MIQGVDSWQVCMWALGATVWLARLLRRAAGS